MTPFESLGICKGFKRVRETKGEAWQIALPFLRTVSFNWLLGHNLPGLFFASSSCSWGHLPAPAPQKNTHTHTHTHRIFKKSIQAYFQNTPEKSRFSSKVYRETGDLTRTIFPDLTSFHSPLAHCTPRRISLQTHTMHALASDLDFYLSHCLKRSSSSVHDSVLLAFRSRFTDSCRQVFPDHWNSIPPSFTLPSSSASPLAVSVMHVVCLPLECHIH